MRHYLALGYSSNSKSETGEILYLGHDRNDALAITNEPSGVFTRKEMHELSTPHIQKRYGDDSANES